MACVKIAARHFRIARPGAIFTQHFQVMWGMAGDSRISLILYRESNKESQSNSRMLKRQRVQEGSVSWNYGRGFF